MKKFILGSTFILLLVGGMNAYASEVFEAYNTTVGKLGGSGYSGYQTKSITGAAGEIYPISVGGGYKVDARLISDNSKGDWSTGIDNYTSHRYLYNKISKNENTRVEFSNALNTTVSVQVTGQFRVN